MLDTIAGFVRDCFCAPLLRDTIVRLEHRLAEAHENVERLNREVETQQAEIQRLLHELGECRLAEAKARQAQTALEQEPAARRAPVFGEVPESRHGSPAGW